MSKPNQSVYPIITPGFVYGDGSVESPTVEQIGLTKLEYFAGLAMQGMLASGKGNANWNGNDYTEIAENSVACALDFILRLQSLPSAQND